DLGGDAAVLARPRSATGRTGRGGRQTQDGPDVSLVSRPVVTVGERRRANAAGRLPGLVRPGDGGVQRVGERFGPGTAGESAGRDGGEEHDARCGGRDEGTDPGVPGRGTAGGRDASRAARGRLKKQWTNRPTTPRSRSSVSDACSRRRPDSPSIGRTSRPRWTASARSRRRTGTPTTTSTPTRSGRT